MKKSFQKIMFMFAFILGTYLYAHGGFTSLAKGANYALLPAVFTGSRVLRQIAPGGKKMFLDPSSKNIGTSTGGNAQQQQTYATPSIIIPQKDYQFTDPADIMSANMYALPYAFNVQVASAGGGVATTVYLFNELAQGLNNAVTTNGSGANSITYSYQDGATFAGRAISNMLKNARQGMGAIIFGVALVVTTTIGGAGNVAGLAALNPTFGQWTYANQFIPNSMTITADWTRKDNTTYISVLRCTQNVTANTQFQMLMPTLSTVIATFYTNPNFSV